MTNSVDILSILKARFGYDRFWHPQKQIIEDVLAKRDVLAVMPTGGGKSLCYQLPALVLPGVTLVVSPLIALMKDQVDALNANGVPSRFINSSLTYRESLQVQNEVKSGVVKLLYVAPERLPIPVFRRFLQEANLNLIAIDEAHCISEWGHEFRPDYRNLLELRRSFPSTPVIALTATATEKVREDIADQLEIGSDRMYVSSFNRSNLRYRVRPRDGGAFEELVGLLGSHRGEASIIYCFSRKDTDDLARQLRERGISALPYHAGLDAETRRDTQDKFIQDRIPAIVATIAFGMGIDKPDVRLVVHYSLPKSIEAYYQETGRAGRDGIPSECVALLSPGDRVKQEYFIRQMEDDAEQRNAREKLDKIVQYAQSPSCRRRFLLGYFGEEYGEESCEACDICLDTSTTFDATEAAQKILSAVVRTGENFGTNYVVDVLVGSKNKKIAASCHDELSVYGIVKEFSRKQLKELFGQLESKGLLVRSKGDYPTLSLSPEGWEFLRKRTQLSLVRPAEDRKGQRYKSATDPVQFDQRLFEELRALRKELAEERNVPPYVVFGNTSLIQMATTYPQDEDEFSDIQGVGRVKLKEYGPKFTSFIRDYVKANGITKHRYGSLTGRGKSGGGDINGRRPSPNGETLRDMVCRGLTLEEIAERRGLDKATIINDIETAASSGPFLDISHLLPNSHRIAKIADAFRDSESSLLYMAKDRLGKGFTYNELKLVRIYLRQRGRLPGG